jgi:hypothetical protein
VPIVGQVKGIAEAALGQDLITGQKLPTWARGVTGALSLLPFAKGAFGVAKGGLRLALGSLRLAAGSSGLRQLAALAYRLGGKIDPRKLFLAARGLSRLSEESLRIASRVHADKALSAGEKAAVNEVARAFEGLEAESRLSRTASGVIEDWRSLGRTESGTMISKAAAAGADVTAKALSKAAQSLVDAGYLLQAIEALENLGVKVTAKMAANLKALGSTSRDFVNLFHQSKGFQRVVADLAKGGNKQIGAEFVMRFATNHPDILNKVRANPLLVAFEWGAGIKKTRRFGDIFAREVDIVVRGDAAIGEGDTIYHELKSWTEATFRASKGKKLPQQWVRDTALLNPHNIRWVFNGAKMADKNKIIATFLELIQRDAYLTKVWGNDRDAITEALKRVVTIFP